MENQLTPEQQEYEQLKSHFKPDEIHIELIIPQDPMKIGAIYKDVRITHKPSGVVIISE